MGNKKSHVPQPTNSNLNADLAELKEIEKVITSQLNELGEKVDSFNCQTGWIREFKNRTDSISMP